MKKADQISIAGEYDTLLPFKSKSYLTDYTGPVKKVLRAILLKAESLMTAGVSSPEVLPEDAFLKKYTGRFRIPILQDVVLKRGAYSNFQQVLTNSPQYVKYMPKNDFASYDIVVKDTNGAIVNWKDLWGYSDGNTIYVLRKSRYSTSFFPLIKEGNSLLISLRSPDTAADRSGARAANAFLLFLAALSHGNAAGGPADDAVVPPILTEKAGRKKYQTIGFEINMQTGEIDF
jgi:hypothetical protein